jgi:enediyne biosynthesis protein E4
MHLRRLRLGTVFALVAGVAVWGGLRAIEARRFRATLDQAKQEMAAGLYTKAWKRLTGIPPDRDGDGEVAYRLGLCELHRGRHAAALAAWERVAQGTPYAARADVERVRLTIDLGQLTRAEAIGQAALRRAARPERNELLRLLERLYMPRFADEAGSVGLRFVHENGRSEPKLFPGTMSGGVGLLDYDGDGWLDVYCVQGGRFPPPATQGGGDRLFRNRGDGTFEDVTATAGLTAFPGGYGHGVAVGDYDNDGHPDLFVTRWRSYALYRNRGDGTFEDVTVRSGLEGDRDWPTSAAFADLDNDGDIDLYVCHYLKWDAGRSRPSRRLGLAIQGECDPRCFEALPDHVFRNEKGRFTDVTAAAGVIDGDGRGLGVVAVDVDDDNRVDLFVANDMSANYLWRQLGDFRFDEQGLSAGVACNAQGGYQAGMGIAAGDLDGDGRIDLAVTNFTNESTTFFRNLGPGLFADHTTAVGLSVPTRNLVGFGLAFLDANNDGRLDVISANGHVIDERPAVAWTMPVQLLAGAPGGRLIDASSRAGPPFEPLHLGRGLAAGDLDNDGLMDVVVVAQNEPLIYLHNRTIGGGHWLRIRLEGVQSNRDGVGARVELVAAGQRRVAQRVGGGSYQSAGDPRLHFGLGTAARVERLEVRWPSGQVDRYDGLDADRGYLAREGDAELRGDPER